ncbi:MAG: inositol monophosphatase family protein [Cyclobacteriaceae bacterium]
MNLEKITGQVVSAALDAGAFIRRERQRFSKKHVELKGKSDLVSYVDKEAEKMLVETLRPLVADAGFLTEEETVSQDSKEYTWIIDPLDGTTNFVHGLPNFCVSVALQHNDELIVGVVYEVANDECFYGWKDGGAYLNEEPINVAPEHNIGDCVFATGFPIYNFDKLEDYLSILNELMKNTRGLRRMGSAAADLAYVACGRYGGFFEYNLNPWDVAAGILLVKEAGGEVTDFKGGGNFLFGREIVAGGAVHPKLLTIVQERW